MSESSLRRRVSPAGTLRQFRPRQALDAAITLLFGGPVELPQIRGLSRYAKGLLLAAALTVLAGMVLLVAAPMGSAPKPGWEIGAGEIDALAGLLFGSSLALHASRNYLLGVPGCAVSSFLAVLLATFAGLTLYITGFAPAVISGVAASAGRQHVAVALALAGVLAAFLLIATPWSPYRKVAQPGLTAVAVLAPVLALVTQAGPRAFDDGFGSLPLISGDPILLVASVAGLLAVPLVVAGSIEWVSGCVGAGFRLTGLLDKPDRTWVRAVVVSVVLLWLALGLPGWLPGWLGGQLGAWPLIRAAHPDAWLLAVVLTAGAAWFVGRARGRLDLAEATSAAYIPTALLFYVGVAAAMYILYVGLRFVWRETFPAAVPEMLVSIGVFVLAAAALWSARGRRWRRAAAMAALGTCCAAAIVAGFRWPTGALPNQITASLPFGLTFMGRGLDSAVLLAAAAGLAALFSLVAWLIFAAWAARSVQGTNLDGSPAGQTGYETVVLVFGFWSLALCGAALLRIREGPLVSAFTHPVLPDPVVFAVVAVPAAAIVALTQWRARREIAAAALCVVLVMPVIAFLPFALPASVGPAGRLAVLALAAPIIYGLTLGGRDLNRNAGTERRLGWLAGTSAIVIPLLGYLAVVGNERGSLTSLLTETGQAGGTGLGSHLRLVLLLPLFVMFVSARRTPFAELRSAPAPSRSHAFAADVLVLSVRDGDLGEIYLDRLRRHLAAATGQEQASYACKLAQRLSRPYSPPRRSVRLSRPGHPAAKAVHAKPAPSYPRPESVSFALGVAERQLRGPEPRPSELARARSLMAGELPPAPAGDRAALRAHDTIEVLRCALTGSDGMTDACLGALVTASGHEVEDHAEKLISGPHSGAEYERNVAITRGQIGAQLASVEGPFTVFDLPVQFMWLAPAMVLDDPRGVRQGVEMPGKHPYLYIGTILAVVAVLAAIIFVHQAGLPG